MKKLQGSRSKIENKNQQDLQRHIGYFDHVPRFNLHPQPISPQRSIHSQPSLNRNERRQLESKFWFELDSMNSPIQPNYVLAAQLSNLKLGTFPILSIAAGLLLLGLKAVQVRKKVKSSFKFCNKFIMEIEIAIFQSIRPCVLDHIG